MRAVLAALLLIGLGQAPAAADCAVPETTVEMIGCANADLKAADDRLNQVYRRHRDGLDELGHDLLLKAQRAWIKFRDAECQRERDVARGGTMAPVLQLSCLTHLTKRRTNDLLSGMAEIRTSERPVVWLPGRTADGPYRCGGETLAAKAGLAGVYDIDADTARVVAVIDVAGERVDIPVGGNAQDALCGPDIRLSTVGGGEGCALLRVDDGMCDAFFVSPDGHGFLRAERAN